MPSKCERCGTRGVTQLSVGQGRQCVACGKVQGEVVRGPNPLEHNPWKRKLYTELDSGMDAGLLQH